MRTTTKENLIRRYFLGDLPPEERSRFEAQYLADSGFFEELLATENDLIDAYVRGELQQSERQRFEMEYFKSPLQRERVDFARALSQVADLPVQALAATQDASPWKQVWRVLSIPHHMPRWALATAVLLIGVSGSWLMVQNHRLKAGMQQATAGKAELRREADVLREHIARLEESPAGQIHQSQQGSEVAKLEAPGEQEVMFRLSPGIMRGPGEAQKTLVLPPAAKHLWLELMIDQGDHPRYEAVLYTADEKEVLRKSALRSHAVDGNTAVSWRVPAHELPSGDYIVQLKGLTAGGALEDVEAYSFRVLQR